MTERAHMGAQYGADPRDRQANGDGRKLDGIAEAVRELKGKGSSLKVGKTLENGLQSLKAGRTIEILLAEGK